MSDKPAWTQLSELLSALQTIHNSPREKFKDAIRASGYGVLIAFIALWSASAANRPIAASCIFAALAGLIAWPIFYRELRK